jgi:hypothetical protein
MSPAGLKRAEPTDPPRPTTNLATTRHCFRRIIAVFPNILPMVSEGINLYNKSERHMLCRGSLAGTGNLMGSNMTTALRANYLTSPMRTMAIHLYHLEPGGFNRVSLARFRAASFEDVTPGTVRQQVEKRFRDLISSDPNLPRIIVVAPAMGEPPGEIIAAELIHAQPVRGKKRPARELVWLTDPSTGIV